MSLNKLCENKGAVRTRKRVGRGIGSGRGKTSGRGAKGQKARSGVSLLGFEGGQMPLFRRLPKRGFTPPSRKATALISLAWLQAALESGALNSSVPITCASLRKAGLLKKKYKALSLVANGILKHSLEIVVDSVSTQARASIESLGGRVTLHRDLKLEEGIASSE